MKEKTRVFEVQKTIIREEVDNKRFILQQDEKGMWELHCPDAQNFNAEELTHITDKIVELNLRLDKKNCTEK